MEDPVSASLDGSAFDSNQHATNISAVDIEFFNAYTPRLKLYI